jgi:undecaprenyl-diphosphatase
VDRRVLKLFLVLLIPIAGLWAFTWIAGEVGEGETRALDEQILMALRNPADPSDPIGPEWVEEMGRDLTALGGVIVLTLVTSVVAGYLAIRRHAGALAFLLVSTIGGLVISTLMKGWFNRPRPSLVAHLSHVESSSFPSGHSMLSAVVYLTQAALLSHLVRNVTVKIYFVVVAVVLTGLVGVSRVYLGVHYPTDVLAGWSLGLGWAALCWLAASALQRRGVVEPASGPTGDSNHSES